MALYRQPGRRSREIFGRGGAWRLRQVHRASISAGGGAFGPCPLEVLGGGGRSGLRGSRPTVLQAGGHRLVGVSPIIISQRNQRDRGLSCMSRWRNMRREPRGAPFLIAVCPNGYNYTALKNLPDCDKMLIGARTLWRGIILQLLHHQRLGDIMKRILLFVAVLIAVPNSLLATDYEELARYWVL